jgi:hypothetical protein
MKLNKNIAIKAFAFLWCILSIMLLTNNAVFIHIHKLPDGDIIIHAHPYNKAENTSSQTQHHHTDFELFILQQLQTLFVLSIVGIALFKIFFYLKKETYSSPQVNQIFFRLSLSRAPPVLIH